MESVINYVSVDVDEIGISKTPTTFFDNKLEWLTSREAAVFLRVSVGQIRNMVWRRQIKFYRLGRRLRFLKRDVEKLLRPAGME